MDIIYKDNDNTLELYDLKNESTGVYVNSATVTVTLKDICGNIPTGQIFPTTMVYVPSSNGKYRCILQNTIVLKSHVIYVAYISVDGDGLQAQFTKRMIAKSRDT